MSDFRTKLLGIAALGVAMAGISYGQVTLGVATAGPELTLRAEGETELVGDTQTTFANAGAAIANVTVYATLSVPVTGKLVSGVTGVNTTAVLTATGGQTIQGTANGTTVTFTGLTLQAAGNTVITISDIRVNATGAGNPLVTESILVSYPNGVTSSNLAGSGQPVSVGYILPSLSSGLPSGTFLGPFQTCIGGTSLTTGITNPVLNVTSGPTFTYKLNELTAGAWRTQAQENDPAVASDATQATQIALAFANVPSSATIYVPLSVSTPGGTILNLAGTPTPYSTTVPYAGFTPTNNTVTITYAVTTGTATTGTAAVPVYISFKANSAAAQSTAITILASYAPSATITGPTGTIPTFAVSTATPTSLETITNCQTTLLFPYVTNVTGFETGIAIVNTTTDNLGTIPGFPSAATPISGACTVNFYPGGAATQPAAYTTPVIGVGGTATGSVAANTLSAMSGAANFTGYAIASCPFPEAHGFAYIVDNFGTPSGTAEGYLAVVVPSNRGEGAGTSGTFGNNVPGITAQ